MYMYASWQWQCHAVIRMKDLHVLVGYYLRLRNLLHFLIDSLVLTHLSYVLMYYCLCNSLTGRHKHINVRNEGQLSFGWI